MNKTLAAGALAAAMLLAACSGGAKKSPGAPATVAKNPASVSGDITVLTNRTDMVSDGSFKKYAGDFNKIYPNVHVKFEAITDYEGEVRIRMNTTDYGDVLLIPSVSVVPGDQLPSSSPRSAGPTTWPRSTASPTEQTSTARSTASPRPATPTAFVYNKAVWQRPASPTGRPRPTSSSPT